MNKFKLEDVKQKLRNNCDVRYRDIRCDGENVHLIYIDNLCNPREISSYIIEPLLLRMKRTDDLDTIMHSLVESSNAAELLDLEECIKYVLSGYVAVLFPHLKKAFYCNVKGYKKRSIEIPQTETVIKGPREGFTEDLQDNLSGIRRRIKSDKLKVEYFELGRSSRTGTVMMYIDGIAPERIVNYIRNKLQLIDKDYVIYLNYIEDSLKSRFTPFDTIGFTEKPDVAAAKLIDGRIIIIMDNNSFVMTAPYFFIENFQTSDDYTLNPYMANMGRLLRWIAFGMSVLIPGIYLALITYHYKLVPSIFLYRMAIFRAGVPVPTVVELLYMTVFFQIIREAGVRLPQPIGPTLSIVGALILGEAAVTSGLASQVTVVIVAISSIASYLVPNLHAPIFVWEIFIIIMASLTGLPGFYTGFVLFVAHLSGLTTCGYPYLFPLGTLKKFKFKDTILRGNLMEVSRHRMPEDENND